MRTCFSGSCWELVQRGWSEGRSMMGKRQKTKQRVSCPLSSPSDCSRAARPDSGGPQTPDLGSSGDLQGRPPLGKSGLENQMVL